LQKSNNPFAQQYNLANKFVVMYSGNLGITHDIESIIYAAEKLKNNLAIQFVIIGGGAKKEKIKQMVMDLNLTNVLLLPYQDKEVLPYTLSCADIGVVTLDKGAENISVPSKVYYLLAAGSVILALSSKNSELGLLINKYKCGKIIDEASVESITEFILHLQKNKYDLEKFKNESRMASFDFTSENAKIYFDYIHNQK
jgi:glycosyltransferase involved in cell wall biosynthesis